MATTGLTAATMRLFSF